jgi:hypothetical protein
MFPNANKHFCGVPMNPTPHLANLPLINPIPTDNEVAEAIFTSIGVQRRMEEGDATAADLVVAERRKRHFLDASIAADIAAGGYIGVQAQAIALQVTAALNAPYGALANIHAQIVQTQNQVMQFQNQVGQQVTQFQNQVGQQVTQLQNQLTQLQNQVNQLQLDTVENVNASQLAEARYYNGIGIQPIVLPSLKIAGVLTQPPFPFRDLLALDQLTGPQLLQNLQFYGLQVPHGLTSRKKRLAMHIGLKYEIL